MVALKLATVTPPSHRVIDVFIVSRDLTGAREATTQISQHVALFPPSKLVMNRPQPWLAVRPCGCKRLERDLDWDPVRRRVQEAAGAQAGRPW